MDEKKKILIIEDEKPLLNILTKLLIKEGYLVEQAEDGKEGLSKVESFMPDLILLDLLLPKINGMDFLKILREERGKVDISVIILTNLDSKDTVLEASKYSVSVYFVKANTSLNVLKKWIHDMLTSSGSHKH